MRRPLLFLLLTALALANWSCASQDPSALPSEIHVLGVSGLSWSRIDALIERGELPYFQRILAGGVRAAPQAPDPLDPAALWASIQTGKSAQEHGVFANVETLANGQNSITLSSRRLNMSVWQMLGEGDRTVAVVGFPLTWPAEVVKGQMVSNAITKTRWTETAEVDFVREPGRLDTYPGTLYGEIEGLLQDPDGILREQASRFFVLNEDEFAMVYDQPLGSIFRGDNPLRDFALTHQADRSYLDIAAHLHDTYRPYVTARFLELPQSLQPTYWYFCEPAVYDPPVASHRRFKETVNEAYRFIDTALGEILDDMDKDATLIVVGDHGFGTSYQPDDEGTQLPVPEASPEAVLILYGQGIQEGIRLAGGRVSDFTPTLLALSGVLIGEDLEGKTLTAAFTPEFLAQHNPAYRHSYDSDWDRQRRYPFQAGEAPPETP